MTIDDKLKALPLLGASAEPEGRGGPSEHALADFQRRIEAHVAGPQTAVESVEAAERRRLIAEIRMMRRYRLNVAIEGVVHGVIYAGGAWGVYHLCRWIIAELRRPPSTPAVNAASVPPQAASPTDRRSIERIT